MANQDAGTAAVGVNPTANLRKVAYSTEEAAEVSGLSRAYIYAEWQAGRGPRKVKAGKRTLITDEALRTWLRSLEVAPSPKGYSFQSRNNARMRT